MVHFNWLQMIPGVGHGEGYLVDIHVATTLLSAVLLLALAFFGRLALGTGETAVAPAGSFSLKGVIETITEFIISLCDMVIGDQGRKYVPMFTAIFLFIFVNNIIGLIPGMTPATDNLNTTFALGLFAFVVYNFEGLKEHGVINYLKHFMGPILLLAPLIFAIELVSHAARPLSLGLRLFGNMMGDHTVLGVFLGLFPAWVPVPVIFYGLGLFVCFMQAFVFTMLTMVYISMATSHDH